MTKIATLLTFIVSMATSQAQFFDTTGIGNQWPQLYNSYETWMTGAFDANRDLNNPSDFGWGMYDMSSHIIMGDSIYILKTINGNYKAISIDQFSSGVYSVTYSDLDGSNCVTKTFDRSGYDDRNFFYYSIDDDQVKNLEPATADWDVVFTKYLTMFPGFGGYPVAGVLSNNGVEVSQVEFAPSGSYSVADTTTFPMSENISTIGYDWKSAGPSGTVIHDTLIYYVKDQVGNVNELKFTGYGGSGTGKMHFEVNGLPDSVALGSGNSEQVYYSLQNHNELSANADNNWDLALYAQSSFSAIPVRINDVNGAELYVYPNADISYWNSVSLDEPSVNVLSVYPNPASDVVNIALQAEWSSDLNASLIDRSGRVVKSEILALTTGVSEAQISLGDLSAGVYLLRLEGSGITATSRIVVQP